jgi:hypothetical protein
MKKLFTVLACGVLLSASLSAYGQARRFVLIEHFTQASCGPCALTNPGFDQNIIYPNPDKVHHISYHTSWPGVDPMYNHNSAESGVRTSYYSVSAVPSFITVGNPVHPSAYSAWQDQINKMVEDGSPLKVAVIETGVGAQRQVRVVVTNVSEAETPALKLRTAIIEHEVKYMTPPGTNGEKDFPDVFRKMLPNTTGDAIPVLQPGESAEFMYAYDVLSEWKAEEIYTIAFVQNESTKEVLNSGSSRDARGAVTTERTIEQVQPSETKQFSVDVKNTTNESHTFTLQLAGVAPEGWTASMELNGTNYSEGTEFALEGGKSGTLKVAVTPSTVSGVGTYTVKLLSADDAQANASLQSVYVISNVTDLIINNEAKWEELYRTGVAGAGTSTIGVTLSDVFTVAAQDNALKGIRNLFYDIGWTFPALTDKRVTALQQFIDNGGNLFVAGQDIGWDQTMDANANGTPATRAFYQNYLQAQFVEDGSTAYNQLTANTGDEIFGAIPASSLVDVYAGNLYPDVLLPLGDAKPIFYYNGSSAKIGALRSTKGAAKIVYLGVGIESVANTDVKNAILKTSRDWFEGLLTDVEFDERMGSLFARPNPASDVLDIPVTVRPREVTVRVVGIDGVTLIEQRVPAGASSVRLSTTALPSGAYFYSVVDGNSAVHTGKFTVQH